ncbi:hypothetical protein PI124_g5561 [Phytophthora idaei]|nr:hypothetical protein PI125_g4988 [Phytophthora idaei]KAG3132668.1 hypothetical protein PI126_g19537 [Phytophthora idaei]KAG3249823.1 hypothetical protein PI124_g5561 [Phytophthora idaei]
MNLSYVFVVIAATFLAIEALADTNQAGQRLLRTHHVHHTTTADSEERTIPKDALKTLAREFGIEAHKIDDTAYLAKFFSRKQDQYESH